ncbi:MAG: sterol desaturase family protein [Gammaproteobacteria bacterium]
MWHSSVLLLVGFIALLLILEKYRPLRRTRHVLSSRWVTNIAFGVLVVATSWITVNPAINYAFTFPAWGLLINSSLPITMQIIIGFLALDLTFYYWHRLNHEWGLLWRFHQVHHIDPDMDVTTAWRFHWMEIAYSSLFRFLQIALLGVLPQTLIVYELVFQLNTLAHHSNIKLPLKLEKFLALFFVTPRMHGVHHSVYFNESRSNYSSIFNIWDRIHRTLCLYIPQQALTIGLPQFQKLDANRIGFLMQLPFKHQSDSGDTAINLADYLQRRNCEQLNSAKKSELAD